MTKPSDFDLNADDIVATALEIFLESGLDAVSMRSVSTRLGVSPVPLYGRIGNKGALVDAIADRLLADLAPPSNDDEPWSEYALRWARRLRARLGKQPRGRRSGAYHRQGAYSEKASDSTVHMVTKQFLAPMSHGLLLFGPDYFH